VVFSLLVKKHANSLRLHKSPVKDVSKTELTFESLERLSYFEPAVPYRCDIPYTVAHDPGKEGLFHPDGYRPRCIRASP